MTHADFMARFRRSAQRRVRLGLRARVAFAWAIAAGVLAMSVGTVSFGLLRRYLVLQRDEVASRQAFSNARVVRDTLRSTDPDLSGLLESLRSDAGSFPLIRFQGKWYGTASGRGPDVLPRALTTALAAGVTGTQRFSDGHVPLLAVGVVMPAIDAQYVEVFPLETLRHTLALLRNSLIVGSFAGLAIGAALGGWSARRVLRPVTRVAEAAEAMAAGTLDTRLAAERDVDLNRLVDSFNAMTDAVRARIEREVRFASDVSHELRTPLGALSAAVQVLERRRDELPERAGQAVTVIASEVRRLSSMVLDLLEIARIDAGVADVNLQESDIAGLVRLIADSSGLPSDVVETSGSSPYLRAMVDRRRFEQIMRNLFDNAAKYAGGVRRVRIEGVADGVTIHVDDAGPGVDLEARPRIFERFARGSDTQDVPGTGLGLSLAADQAALMHATLTIATSPEAGARFTVHLMPSPADLPGSRR